MANGMRNDCGRISILLPFFSLFSVAVAVVIRELWSKCDRRRQFDTQAKYIFFFLNENIQRNFTQNETLSHAFAFAFVLMWVVR